MKKLKIPLILWTLLALLVTPAFGWGNKGHQTVGKIAELNLNAATRAKVNQILRNGETLSSVATWADEIRDRRVSPTATDADSDTQAFLRNTLNRGNRKWHFVDLPLNCQSYDAGNCETFTESRDIVHIINLCIRRLQGDATVSNLNKRNALRWLVHLVGDLHQPLHVGVGFIDEVADDIVIVRDPATIINRHLQRDSDIGGNILLFTADKRNNLHSFWDTSTVNRLSGNQTVPQFATGLKNNVQPQASWNTQGLPRSWAAQWATDTLGISGSQTYNTIAISDEIVIEERPFYLITANGNYAQNSLPVVRVQLAKGGFRLAKLLETILP